MSVNDTETFAETTRHVPRGFVLLNALIVVVALSATAAVLLSWASSGQTRRSVGQDAAQVHLYLDGFEALAITLLDEDPTGVDHSGESWAQTEVNVEVDRGVLQGSIVDLQGRFNVNWLANAEDQVVRDAFLSLATESGLTSAAANAIVAFLTVGADVSHAGVAAARRPAVDLEGGAVLMVRQLRDVPGLSEKGLARLTPLIATLPGDSKLNVNTASEAVLASLLPGAPRPALQQVLATRDQSPFASLDDFLQRIGQAAGFNAVADIDGTYFGVGSTWFEAHMSAELGSHRVARMAVLSRQPLPIGTQVAYRLKQID